MIFILKQYLLLTFRSDLAEFLRAAVDSPVSVANNPKTRDFEL